MANESLDMKSVSGSNNERCIIFQPHVLRQTSPRGFNMVKQNIGANKSVACVKQDKLRAIVVIGRLGRVELEL